MDGGQELIPIAKVILAELAGGIALRFERGGYGASLCGQAGGRDRLADSGHAGADGELAGDEVRPARRATRLRVIIGEEHAFLGDLVEVRGSPGHHAAMIGADVPHADVIAHNEDDVWFLALRRRSLSGGWVCRLRCRREERHEKSDGALSK